MNKLLVMNFNEVVKPGDLTFFLGDIALGDIKQSLAMVKKLNGKKVLIAGNHDRFWHESGEKYRYWREQYEAVGFQIWEDQSWIRIGNRTVQMCHFPFNGDSENYMRFITDRPVDNGQWLLHGHVHTQWQHQGRMINVGAPVWNYVPVSLERIRHIIETYDGG